jgi:uncharacterized protein (TIGR02271 family)
MDSDIDWKDVLKKEARGKNDEDLGEVQEIINNYILVQRGIINKEKYYIPQSQVESYDGHILRFQITEDDLNKYAGNEDPPSIKEQYISTTAIDSSGGSAGGVKVEEKEETGIPLKSGNQDEGNRNEDSIAKQLVTENKTVQIPVTHEEVTIETRPPSGDTQAQEPVSSKENITIPVKKEQVEIIKTPHFKDETVMKSKPKSETTNTSIENKEG